MLPQYIVNSATCFVILLSVQQLEGCHYLVEQMKVMDNKLFAVSPKKGNLEPGDTQTVTLTYHHTMAGTDRLPVLLKIARGREILVSDSCCHC